MKNKSIHHKTTHIKAHYLKTGNLMQPAQEGHAPQAPKTGTNAQNQFR